MSTLQSHVPFKINQTIPPIKQTLRYNCYTKQYITPKPPKTAKTYNQYIKYSSLRTNDDVWIGNQMAPAPHKRATRFFFQNCNGLLSANDVSKFHYDMNTYKYSLPQFC